MRAAPVAGHVWRFETGFLFLSRFRAVNGFGFSRPRHLVKTDEISSVFSFNRRFSSEHFQVLAKPGACGFARMAVIVSKKTARLATARNYIKRVAREVFRLQQHDLAGLDIVVRVRKSFTQTDYPVVSKELQAQLKLARKNLVLPRPRDAS